jgi:hypothetical protein
LGVQSQQLLMKSQVFKDEVLAGTESADQPAEEMSERRDHSRNYIGKVRIELCAKSFILQVYDVLARHSLTFSVLLVSASEQGNSGKLSFDTGVTITRFTPMLSTKTWDTVSGWCLGHVTGLDAGAPIVHTGTMIVGSCDGPVAKDNTVEGKLAENLSNLNLAVLSMQKAREEQIRGMSQDLKKSIDKRFSKLDSQLGQNESIRLLRNQILADVNRSIAKAVQQTPNSGATQTN